MNGGRWGGSGCGPRTDLSGWGIQGWVVGSVVSFTWIGRGHIWCGWEALGGERSRKDGGDVGDKLDRRMGGYTVNV
ncbi:hypothetical protein Tco_1120885 [Tanacetum coccineum]|uniref:Uncharacterized protein n=1 Tax=Tanacetum coccineum TaxID=301880 RepID=A0ABQ5IW54_9ASTR